MIDYNSDWYCKMFVDTSMDKDKFMEHIANIIKGEKKNITGLKNQYIEVHVRKNNEHDELKKMNKLDGFLFFKYYLETFPEEKISFEDYIEQIKLLVKNLRNQGFKVIPVYFEDELNEGKDYKEFMK